MKERTTTQGPRIKASDDSEDRRDESPSTDPAGTQSFAPPPTEAPEATRASPQASKKTLLDGPETEITAPPGPSSAHVSVDYDSEPDDRPTLEELQPNPLPARRLDARHLSSGTAARYQPQGALAPPKDDSSTTLQSMQRPDGLSFGPADTRRFLRLEREVDELSVALRLQQKEAQKAQKLAQAALALAAACLILAGLALALYADARR